MRSPVSASKNILPLHREHSTGMGLIGATTSHLQGSDVRMKHTGWD